MRCHMTLEQLIQSIQDTDAKDAEKRQLDALRRFVESRGYNDNHGDGFLDILKET